MYFIAHGTGLCKDILYMCKMLSVSTYLFPLSPFLLPLIPFDPWDSLVLTFMPRVWFYGSVWNLGTTREKRQAFETSLCALLMSSCVITTLSSPHFSPPPPFLLRQGLCRQVWPWTPEPGLASFVFYGWKENSVVHIWHPVLCWWPPRWLCHLAALKEGDSDDGISLTCLGDVLIFLFCGLLSTLYCQ